MPDAASNPEPERPFGAPENELPVTVPIDLLLVRTADLAVTLTGVQVYRNGVAFAVNARCRTPSALPASLHLLHGMRTGWEGSQLLLGMQFADGRTVTNVRVGDWRPRAQPHHDTPQLHTSGGGGTDRNTTARMFLSPLPPPGLLTVYAAWPSMGIPEARHELTATTIIEAATRAVELWPAEPDHDTPPEQPGPPLNVPPRGWFDHVLGRWNPPSNACQRGRPHNEKGLPLTPPRPVTGQSASGTTCGTAVR